MSGLRIRSACAYIEVDEVRKAYAGDPVIAGLSMTVSQGELVSLLGPNGCGKTTFLKLLTGIDREFQGSLRVGGKAPEEARVGIVPQDSDTALLPWRTVVDNIALPLELDGASRHENRQAVQAFLEGAGVSLPLNRYSYRLSGGQKRLAVILQALIGKPDILVLDEPFASLDYENAKLIEDSLLRLWEFTATTTLIVTHDLLSAAYLSDRVVLVSPRPMRIICSRTIDLPRPRSRGDPVLVSLLNELQGVLLKGG